MAYFSKQFNCILEGIRWINLVDESNFKILKIQITPNWGKVPRYTAKYRFKTQLNSINFPLQLSS